MTLPELLKVRPYDTLLLRGHEYHVIGIDIGDKIVLRVIGGLDWVTYQKFYTVDPGHDYRTIAEVEGLERPEEKRWAFTFTRSNEAEIVRSEHHLKILTKANREYITDDTKKAE